MMTGPPVSSPHTVAAAALVVLLATSTVVLCSYDRYGTAYNVFICEFDPTDIFSADIGDGVAVDYTPSLLNSPGLPSWLTYTQADTSSSTGFMYGTPSSGEVGLQSFKVIALNKETYETAVKYFKVEILANDDPPANRLTLLVENLDLTDALNSSDVREAVVTVAKNWWPVNELVVVSLMSRVDGGGRYLPPGEDAGVYFELGAASDFSDDVYELAEEFVNCSTVVPPVANTTDTGGFDFDWCSVTLDTVDFPTVTTTPTPDSGVTNVTLGSGSFTPREKGAEMIDMTVDFCITVFVPLGIALILFLILSYIMFGRRVGLRKRLANTPGCLLSQHSAIKKATGELRHMSNTRVPKSPSSAVTTPSLSASRSSKGTPPTVKSKPKATPPPPYRCPRVLEGGDTHLKQETSFSLDAANLLSNDSTGLLHSPNTEQGCV